MKFSAIFAATLCFLTACSREDETSKERNQPAKSAPEQISRYLLVCQGTQLTDGVPGADHMSWIVNEAGNESNKIIRADTGYSICNNTGFCDVKIKPNSIGVKIVKLATIGGEEVSVDLDYLINRVDGTAQLTGQLATPNGDDHVTVHKVVGSYTCERRKADDHRI